MVDPKSVNRFLSHPRLALIGASDDPKSFGHTIYAALQAHGYDVVGVNPHVDSVEGHRCFPTVSAVPGGIDAAMIMVNAGASAQAVRDAADAGATSVWLFKGLGGPGAVSDEAVAECKTRGLAVVEGACPLMFLEPVGWSHKTHRAMRRLNGTLARAS
jgi:predicted CoA-binding protein